MKTVLIAIDVPAAAGPTMDAAIILARAFGARLVALHVVPPPVAGPSAAPQHPHDAAARSEHAAQQLADLQRRLLRRGVTIETRHVVGHPGQRIVELAALLPAAYVVIGAGDRSGLASPDPGGNALQVLRGASCPVVVVPPTARL